MAGTANSGRRPAPPVDLERLQELSITQVLRLMRLQGRRPMGRAKLHAEIALGRLRAHLDSQRLTNKREPSYVVLRKDYDRWVEARLRPLAIRLAS